MTTHSTASREEWLAARLDLLEAEKDLTRRSDDVAHRRQQLPWVPVEKDYRFETEAGAASLADLFGGRSQLVVYHFMFGPDYEAGCPVCSSIADSFNGVLAHLEARDVTMICVSRAPLEKLLAFRERMGWGFNWASSYDSDFNWDYEHSATREQVSERADQLPPAVSQFASASGTDLAGYIAERPGLSVFAQSDEQVYLTYAAGARGLEVAMPYYGILDRVPHGRGEEDPFWIRHHDSYEPARDAGAGE